MKRNISRRETLKLAGLGLAATGLNSILASSAAAAPQGGPTPKVLLIFLRGGNDGTNTVIPHGDPQYFALRNDIAIAPSEALTLDTAGYCRLHPGLQPIHPLFQSGKVALMHRIGLDQNSSSHFTAQDYWENLDPADPAAPEGFVPRLTDQLGSTSLLKGVSCTGRQQKTFFTTNPAQLQAHVPDLASFAIPTDGLAGHFTNPPLPHQPAGKDWDNLLRRNGEVMLETINQTSTLPVPYVPFGGAAYPVGASSRLGDRLQDAVQLLRNTDARIAAVDHGSYDHHSFQGGADPGFGTSSADPDAYPHHHRLHELATGIQAVRDDMGANPNGVDLLILVYSEFGRGSIDNDSKGTDHGGASVMMAIGDNVAPLPGGGVHNCNATDWPANNTLLSDTFGGTPTNTFVAPKTDYRAVFAEMFTKHLNVPTSLLPAIIPNYGSLSGPLFQQLNYLV